MASEKTAYEWKDCVIDLNDNKQKEAIQEAMLPLSQPWQNIDKMKPCRKTWRIHVSIFS